MILPFYSNVLNFRVAACIPQITLSTFTLKIVFTACGIIASIDYTWAIPVLFSITSKPESLRFHITVVIYGQSGMK